MSGGYHTSILCLRRYREHQKKAKHQGMRAFHYTPLIGSCLGPGLSGIMPSIVVLGNNPPRSRAATTASFHAHVSGCLASSRYISMVAGNRSIELMPSYGSCRETPSPWQWRCGAPETPCGCYGFWPCGYRIPTEALGCQPLVLVFLMQLLMIRKDMVLAFVHSLR
jgi:hypothetical protein